MKPEPSNAPLAASTVIPIYHPDSVHPQARVCARCAVRGDALFGVLDGPSLERIHMRIDSLERAAGTAIYHRGGAGDALYTIRAGLVRFERSTARGDRRIVRIAGRGDLIGQEALLSRPYADDAVACTPVQLCRIPRGLVDELGSGSLALPRELMSRWQKALDEAEAWVADLSTGPVRRRLLRLLLKLADLGEPVTDAAADAAPTAIWLPRRDEIGAMLDITFETASRLVSQMRREGVLMLAGSRSATLDRTALLQAIDAQDRV